MRSKWPIPSSPSSHGPWSHPVRQNRIVYPPCSHRGTRRVLRSLAAHASMQMGDLPSPSGSFDPASQPRITLCLSRYSSHLVPGQTTRGRREASLGCKKNSKLGGEVRRRKFTGLTADSIGLEMTVNPNLSWLRTHLRGWVRGSGIKSTSALLNVFKP